MDKKSPDAFRTISEVADWLGVPTHVLRFWESRFTHVKPVKRAGGRRYYRPADMELLGGIRKLLHEDGMTIRGVQKLLREQGVKHVAAMSPALDDMGQTAADASNVVPLTSARGTAEDAAPQAEDVSQEPTEEAPIAAPEPEPQPEPVPEREPEPEVAAPDSPPTLTDTVNEAVDKADEVQPDQPVPQAPAPAPAAPVERDLFAPEVPQDPEPAGAEPEHPHEPTELEADVAEATAEASATAEADGLSADAPAPEPDPEPTPVAETDPAYIAPPPRPIDVSHIAADVADDAFTPSPNVSTITQLRALRARGGSLPDDALRSLTARLTSLAARMAAAPSDTNTDTGRAE